MISQRFPATPDQVRPARTFVTEVLGNDHPLHDDAVLLTSELAANAVEHSGGPHDAGPADPPREFVVTVAFLPHGVLITVQDSGISEIPCTRNSGPDATGGRGLMLVNSLAARWGFQRDSAGTLIWFELESAGAALSGREGKNSIAADESFGKAHMCERALRPRQPIRPFLPIRPLNICIWC
ncbi:ATP-binding protein [Streptosporangium sp. NBC_01469]|uniref:ATP-binding protein n=1 Tax=Streptosporangium sp. NBC_01469 TaxID=2903898 RepID=UPI002E28B95D|nr:ATP-binding protein [Streptosporangium sp. NBC_01469]